MSYRNRRVSPVIYLAHLGHGSGPLAEALGLEYRSSPMNIHVQNLLLAAAKEQFRHQVSHDDRTTVDVGTALGPFPVRYARIGETIGAGTFTLYDLRGELRRFVALGAGHSLLTRLQRAPTPAAANAHVVLSENSLLYIFVWRPLAALSELRPIFVAGPGPALTQNDSTMVSDYGTNAANKRRFECDDCTLSFTNPETLINHRAYYCKKSTAQNTAGSVVFLPIVCTKNEIGTTVLPVLLSNATSRDDLISPAQVRSALPYSSTPSGSSTTSADGNDGDVYGPDENRPLDLRTRRRRAADENGAPQKRPKRDGDEVTRPFACDCGVSFLSRETYDGHRKYYCRNRESTAVVETPSDCARCRRSPTRRFAPGHGPTALTRCIVCQLCGYRGYSERGIRNHLRVAHDQPLSEWTARPAAATVIAAK